MSGPMVPGKLALEDGTVYAGRAFGASGEVFGEAVFNTSMTGYQEILTDPSYKGQIVTMTYPLIGNYGVNLEDLESQRPQVEGFVIRELSRVVSNCRATGGLAEYLAQHRIIGLEGVDTRSLVRHIRSKGAMKAVLSTVDLDDASLVRKAAESAGLLGRDLVREVMPGQSYEWTEGFNSPFAENAIRMTGFAFEPTSAFPDGTNGRPDGPRPHVVAMDFGMKRNILRYLVASGWRVSVVPGNTPAAEILALDPQGIFLSNGPGDPEAVTYGVATIRTLIAEAAAQRGTPIFGICLGHQLLGLALGGSIFKLRFGHRGANQPVINHLTERVEITTQNHGFAVALEDLPAQLEATHINLNDRTLEGMRHRELPIFSVQYHPESSAGPHDSAYLFQEFRRRVQDVQA